MIFSYSGNKGLIKLLGILIILRSFHGMAVHNFKVLIQLFIFKCTCHISSPFPCNFKLKNSNQACFRNNPAFLITLL